MLTRIARTFRSLCGANTEALRPPVRTLGIVVAIFAAMLLVVGPAVASAQAPRPEPGASGGASIAQPTAQTGRATAAGPSGEAASNASADAERLVLLGPGDSVTISVF